MKIAVGSDHRGFATKEQIRALLEGLGHEVQDFGTYATESCDYPEVGLRVAEQVSEGAMHRGILICGSGIGMSITANKVEGVRAALCYDAFSAEMSRRHNDANVLCIGADRVSDVMIADMVRAWVGTEFEGGRHARRIEKIAAYEANRCSKSASTT